MTETKKKGFLVRFLDMVEKGGNKLPHPVILFLLFSAVVILVSAICAAFGVEVTYEALNRSTNEIESTTTAAISLLSGDGIRHIFSAATKNFVGFAPLGTVLVGMLGVSVAENSGLIQSALRKLVLVTPRWLLTAVVVFAGIMSNIASDAGYIVLIPLGAIIFLSFDRHPLAGLAAAFAGVSGGFSANLLVGTLDPLLGGISTEAAQLLDPSYTVNAMDNWFFMIASTFVITILGWVVTEKIVEPRLGTYKGEHKEDLVDLTTEEKKGLSAAGWAALAYAIFMAVIIFIPNTIFGGNLGFFGVLRNPETGSILKDSAFMEGIVFIIALFFFFTGVAYGKKAGTFKSSKSVIDSMADGMASMASYMVLVFVASQFVDYFGYSNLGTIVAVKGAEFLKSISFTGLPLMIAFVLVCAFINLFMGSASAKWAIMAPVFIPMFMQLGFAPEFTQLGYRIGDSTTNIISPLMSYFAFVIAFAEKYDEDAGIGTIISMMLPYSLIFLLGWIALLIVWYVFKLPIGPGATMFLMI